MRADVLKCTGQYLIDGIMVILWKILQLYEVMP